MFRKTKKLKKNNYNFLKYNYTKGILNYDFYNCIKKFIFIFDKLINLITCLRLTKPSQIL